MTPNITMPFLCVSLLNYKCSLPGWVQKLIVVCDTNIPSHYIINIVINEDTKTLDMFKGIIMKCSHSSGRLANEAE
uniref:Uncharacterized protein n=1 Tax=Arion vulgaris TaxID=1028688 RepID=A0A0B7BRJ1_9EUPU